MMDDRDRKRFQAIQVQFAERVDSIEMLGYITCLTEHTRDTVRNSQTAHNGSKLLAAQKLFEALKCRPDGLKQAAYALRQCGHDDLANALEPQQATSQQIFHNPQQPHNLQAPYRNGAPNLPDGSPRYPNSYAMPGNQNTIPFQPYVPGRDTVPNFQNLNMSATYPEALNVGLPRPTWSMSQGPQQGLNSLQQQPVYQHQSFSVVYDRNAPSAHPAPAMSEFPNNLQCDQAAQNFGGIEPSMESLKMYRSQSTGTIIEEKNDLNRAMSFTELLNTAISDTDNEDSDSNLTIKKNIEQEENSSSLSEYDASKIINNQENAELRQTLPNSEVGIEKQVSFRMTEESSDNVPVKLQATGFDSSETTLKELDNPKGSVKNMDNNATHAGFGSSETTLKSPITDNEQNVSSNVKSTIKLSLRSEAVKNYFETEITQENVENIRRECFSDVYSQTASLLPLTPEVSTEGTANVEAMQQPIDQSLEDARIPEMRILRDDSELKSILKKGDKANAFGIPSYRNDDASEDGESCVSDSEERDRAVNSDEGIISTDGIPTTEGNTARDEINGMNEYFEQQNDHPTAMRPEVVENVNAENSTDERLTSWVSFGSSLLSLTYKVLHPDV